METAPERGGRKRRGGGALSLDDCRCPVCLEIFMEPVTLPCNHTYCKECFEESVDKATLCCPLCRKRVSSWARLNSRNNTLVDQQLWIQIQACFPLQCQRRLNGQDAVIEDDLGECFPRVSQPGELKQEYEDQITKLTEEKRVLDEEERRVSEEYIQRLLAEEEELLQEERRRRQDDERLARLLSNQLNSAPVSQENVGPPDVNPAKKKKKDVVGGQMDRFLYPLPSSSSSSDCSFMANKENILRRQVERPLLKLDYYRPMDRSEPSSASSSASMEVQLHPTTHLTGDGRPSSTKRKSLELETTEDEEVMVNKQGCHSLPSSSSSSFLEVGVAEWEAELLSKRKQEEEDRCLALLLQKELDQEERQRATDRRKGSSDPYLLRQNNKGKVEASTSNTPSRLTRKTAKTSTLSSAKTSNPISAKTSTLSCASSGKTTKTSTSSSPSSRGSKQATLTEMFFSLSS